MKLRITLRFTALLLLLQFFNVSTGLFAQNIYSNRIVDSSADFVNAYRAADANRTNYAYLSTTLGLLSTSYITAGFPQSGKAGDVVNIQVQSGTGLLGVAILNNVSVILYDSLGHVSTTVSGGSNLLQLSLLSPGSNIYAIRLLTNPTDNYTFKSARIQFNNVLTLNLLSEFRVYNIFFQQPCPAIQATSVYAFGTNGGLLSGAVINPGDAVDASTTNYAQLTVPLNLLGLLPPAYLDLKFAQMGRGGDYVGFTIGVTSSLVALGVLQNLKIVVYDEFGHGQDSVNSISLADLHLLSGATDKYTTGFSTAKRNYNIARAKITLTGVLGLLEDVDVYNAYHYNIDPTPIVITTSGPTTFCAGGSVTLTAFDSLGVNKFVWSTGGTSAVIKVATSGTYSVSVTDTEGCTRYSIDVATTELPALHPVITGDTVLCQSTTGTLQTALHYAKYLWSDGDVTSTTNIINAGPYSVKVTDTNNCTASDTVVVAKNDLRIIPAITANTCSDGNSGSIGLTVTGGSGNYSYLWSNGGTSNLINSLHSGIYTNIITDNDYHCAYNNAFTVTAGNTLAIKTAVTNTSKCSATDGSITVSAIGGSGNYAYSWNTGAKTATIADLAAGIYIVSVKDNTSLCLTSDTVIVSDGSNSMAVTPSITNSSSCSTPNGLVSLAVTGGSGSYGYTWSNGRTASSIANLAPGSYYVLVKDNTTHCNTAMKVNIGNSAALMVNATVTSTSCNAATGKVSAVVTGGSGSYTYRWNTGATTISINALQTGTYIVAVVDNSKGCVQQGIFTVSAVGSPAVTITPANAGCTSSTNGAVTVTTTDTHLKYSWSNAATTKNIALLTPGTYVLKATDTVTGCIAVDSVIVNLKPQIDLTGSIASNTSCAGSYNGALSVIATGGVGPYTYSWNTGGAVASKASLAPGNYNVTVTDADACSNTLSAAIITDTSRTLKVILDSVTKAKCNGSATGGATAHAKGGLPPYTFHWSTGGTATALANMVPGNYSVTVTDANGCNAIVSFIIPADTTNQINVTADSVIGASCSIAANGNVYTAVTGGATPYVYTWSNGAHTQSLTNVVPATYTLTVTDAHGCTGSLSVNVSVDPVRAVHAVLDSTINTKCGNTNTGAVYVHATGGTVPYGYIWSNGAVTEDLTNVPAGSYTFIVTDAMGCTASVSSTITSVAQLVLALDATGIKCYGDANGAITANVTQGSGSYTYSWNTGATTGTINALNAGNYSVTINDNTTGCTATADTTLTTPDSLQANITTSNISCAGNDGSAQLNVSGGTSPYTYSWPNSTVGSSIAGLAAGDYTVTISDANGCNRVVEFSLDNTGGCDTVIIVHNIITPNGDGINDNLIVEGIQNYPNNSLKIFDKLGDVVYEQERYNNDWHGIDKGGKPLPGGTYFYLLKLNAPNLKGGKSDFTGYIMIQR